VQRMIRNWCFGSLSFFFSIFNGVFWVGLGWFSWLVDRVASFLPHFLLLFVVVIYLLLFFLLCLLFSQLAQIFVLHRCSVQPPS